MAQKNTNLSKKQNFNTVTYTLYVRFLQLWLNLRLGSGRRVGREKNLYEILIRPSLEQIEHHFSIYFSAFITQNQKKNEEEETKVRLAEFD